MNNHSSFPLRVMCFQPHNDDAVIAMGGTLIKLIRRDCDLHYVYVTDSRHGESNRSEAEAMQVRGKEAAQERKLLGVKEFTELGFFDQSLSTLSGSQNQQAISRIQTCLNTWQPNLLIVPSPGEMHPDHRSTHDLVMNAVNQLDIKPPILKYSVWLLPDFYLKPSDPASRVLLVSIDEESELKINLIRCHKSQIARRRYDEAAQSLSHYFAWMMKADKLLQSKSVEILGYYSLTDSPEVPPFLLEALDPVLDITSITHGRNS